MIDLGSAIGYLMLDTSGFTGGVNDAMNSLEAFFDDTLSVQDRLLNLESGLTSVGGALTKSVTLPLVGAGTAVVGFAASSESAFAKFKSQVGDVTGSLEDYKEVQDEIYESNYGESYEDVADSMALIVQRLGEMDTSSLQEATEDALTLRDTMGYEVNESIRSVDTLMKNFGLTAKEAFDFIVKGTQEGLDFSGEFLDTINEYSVQFTKVGFNAQDMFSILQTGVESGSWNLDKVGDAIKEFSIRAIDGSDTTIDAFNRLGMSYEQVGMIFAEGGDKARDAFDAVIEAIESIEDPLEQDMVGVELFGTMWEDLGKEVIFQMGNISESATEMSGAMDSLKETRAATLEASLSELWRTIQAGATSIGELLIPRVQELTEAIQGIVDGFNDLDPQTKEMIVNIGVAVAALGPMLLIMGNITKAVNSGIAAYQALRTSLTAATAAQTGLNAAMSANPVGLIVTGVGILVSVLGSFAISAALAGEKVSRLSDEISDAREEYQELAGEISTNQENTMGMVAALEQLVAQEDKTIAQKEAIKDLVADLNEAVPDLSLAYDEQTDSLNMTTEAIKNAAKAEYERAKQQAAIDRLSEAYTEQIKIAEELEVAQAALEEEQQRYSEAMENSTAKTSRQKDQMYAYSGALIGAQNEVDRLTKLQDQNQTEIAELEAAYGYYANVTMADARQASIELVNQSGRETVEINATTAAIKAKLEALLAMAKADAESAKAAMGQAGVDPVAAAMSVGLYTKAQAEVKAYSDAISRLDEASSSAANTANELNNAVYGGSGTSGASTAVTKATTNLDLYNDAVEKLDHQRAMDLISEEEYYQQKSELGKKYLEEGTSEQMRLEEELYEWEKQKQEEQLKARTEVYEAQRDALKESYEDQEITTEEYLSELNRIQTEYLDEGTEDWIDAIEFRNSEIERLQEEFADAFTDSLDEIGDRYQEAVDDVESARQDLANKLSNTGDLFQVADEKMTLGNLRDDIEQINEYGEALERLRERGISQSLMDEILSLDVDEATEYMGKLIQMTDEDFAEYNALWEEKQQAARDIATRFYQDQLDTIETEFADELMGALAGVPDTMEAAGKEAMESWLVGFESEFDGVFDYIRNLFSTSKLLGSEAALSVGRDLSVLATKGSYSSGLDYVPYDMNVRVHKGESIWTQQQTADLVNAMSTLMSGYGAGDLTITVPVNGVELARATLKNFRSVMDASPEVKSDGR